MSEILKQSRSHRFHYMDGLRGLASLAVCLWHNFLAFFPAAVGLAAPVRAPWLEMGVYKSPLNIFFAGDFSVFIFFVLSGFVISIKFFGVRDIDGIKKAYIRRYIRLMPPAFATIIASYLILHFGLMYNAQAASLASSWWLGYNWHDVQVSFSNALQAGLYDLWFVGIPASASFNSNLGTLTLELIGSYVIFTVILIELRLGFSAKKRYLCHLILIGLAFILRRDDPHYVVFFIGMALADVYQNSSAVYDKLRRFGPLFLIAGVILGTANIGNLPYIPYRFLEACRALNLHPLSYPWAAGAVFLMLGVMLTPAAQRFFEKRFFQILGEYSFSLFVVHTVFLGSVTSYLFMKFMQWNFFGYTGNVFASFMVGLPLLILCTHAVKKIDDKAIDWSRSL